MVADPSVPAAQGGVSLGHDGNGNMILSVHVEHLAQPAQLTPPANSYAIWVQPPGKEPQFVGNLAVDKKLKGVFRGPVAFSSFDVFITPESTQHPESPSATKLLHATVQAGK